mgnify:CR=1 FL=1
MLKFELVVKLSKSLSETLHVKIMSLIVLTLMRLSLSFLAILKFINSPHGELQPCGFLLLFLVILLCIMFPVHHENFKFKIINHQNKLYFHDLFFPEDKLLSNSIHSWTDLSEALSTVTQLILIVGVWSTCSSPNRKVPC